MIHIIKKALAAIERNRLQAFWAALLALIVLFWGSYKEVHDIDELLNRLFGVNWQSIAINSPYARIILIAVNIGLLLRIGNKSARQELEVAQSETSIRDRTVSVLIKYLRFTRDREKMRRASNQISLIKKLLNEYALAPDRMDFPINICTGDARRNPSDPLSAAAQAVEYALSNWDVPDLVVPNRLKPNLQSVKLDKPIQGPLNKWEWDKQATRNINESYFEQHAQNLKLFEECLKIGIAKIEYKNIELDHSIEEIEKTL